MRDADFLKLKSRVRELERAVECLLERIARLESRLEEVHDEVFLKWPSDYR